MYFSGLKQACHYGCFKATSLLESVGYLIAIMVDLSPSIPCTCDQKVMTDLLERIDFRTTVLIIRLLEEENLDQSNFACCLRVLQDSVHHLIHLQFNSAKNDELQNKVKMYLL